jgi:hypothetical protein
MRIFMALLFYVALSAGEIARPEPKMSYLDNGTVKIGADLALGGAITFLSHCDRPQNLINSHDLGRQIQMSHYSGPVPFQPEGKPMKPEWKGIGWNPIQTGDAFHNPSKIIDSKNDGRELYVKCVPMHWPLDNVPGECVYESWTMLDGPTVTMRFRATNARPDHTRYPARNQELPAIYVISSLHRYMIYTGDRPFTGGALSHVENDWKKPWPWTQQVASESWAALVGDDDWGIGVACDDVSLFHGGLHGQPNSFNVRDSSTAYIAPVRIETFDHDIVYNYSTVVTLGSLSEIRERLTKRADHELPQWIFATDRRHWCVQGGVDDGLPKNGEWRIPCETGQSHLIGPVRCWRAEDGPAIIITGSWNGPEGPAKLRWRTLNDEKFNEQCSIPFEFSQDGKPVIIRMDKAVNYSGLITGLRIDPPAGRQAGTALVIRSVIVGQGK